MQAFTDQLHRDVLFPFPPKRIISLVPSQTELLFDLGLKDQIVGVTKFCIHPAAGCKLKAKIGGTKKLNTGMIRELQPDLIIGNKEENDQEQIEELMREFPVWMSDILNLDDALNMIRQLGLVTGKEEKARQIAEQINAGFLQLEAQNQDEKRRIAYLIWKDPYMLAGKNTFINDIIERAGWTNAITAERYPELGEEELRSAKPDWIFLSSEPFPFREKHLAEFRTICPAAKIMIVDGEMFSWYGSRLLLTPSYLQTLSAEQG